MKVLIVGAGGHARVVADILLCASEKGQDVQPVGFVDDDAALAGSPLLGLPVHGPLACVAQVEHDALVVAVGDNRTRARLFERFRARGETFATAIHPSAVLSRDVVVGPGTMICAGVVVNCGAVIGCDVILNTGSSVDHDCRIGNHVHVAPGTRLGGNVTVGEGAFLGIGSAAIPGRAVGEWSTIGAGGLVHRDIPPGVTAVGVPARIRTAEGRAAEDRTAQGQDDRT